MLIVAAISTPALAAPSARTLVQEGKRLFEQEQYEEALQKFQEAKEADPEFTGIDLNIGHTLMKMGRFEEAEEFYNEILNNDEGAAFKGDIDYNRGVSHYLKGSNIIPDPTVEGLLKQGLLEQKQSPDGQPSVELTPEGKEALEKSLEEYSKSLDITQSAIPQISNSQDARANYELAKRQYSKMHKLLELFQPPNQEQQQNDEQKKDEEKEEEQQNQQQQNQDEQEEEEQQQQQQNQGESQDQQQQQNQGDEQEGQQEQEQQNQGDEQEGQQEQQQAQQGQENQEQQGQEGQQAQNAEQEEGMRPEDAKALLSTLNDLPQEEQLKEMIRYQMRGQRSLNPDW